MIEENNEIWKTISECPNYQISNLGRVKSIEHKVKSKNGSMRIVSEKILKPSEDGSGYLKVCLCKEGKEKTIKIHRLVAQYFVQNDSLFNNQVNHKNECKTDNRACNLEWCDASYNVNYGTRNKRISKAQSKAVKCLDTGVVFPSVMEVERLFSFNNSNICACCNGKRKTCGGLHWQYV